MDRRRFLAAGVACGVSFHLIRPSLRLAIRGGTTELRFRDPYQQELRATVAELQAHRHVEALTWDCDYHLIRGRLTGTCDVAADHFPRAFAPILGRWLEAGPGRRVCAVLGEAAIDAYTMADARHLAAILS